MMFLDPVNDMVERRIFRPTAEPLALDEVAQKILHRTAEIARQSRACRTRSSFRLTLIARFGAFLSYPTEPRMHMHCAC